MDITEQLKNSVLLVTFTKTDGSERKMRCTLIDNLIGIKTFSSGPAKEDVIVVWDLEKDAWRSFKPSKIKKVEVVLG